MGMLRYIFSLSFLLCGFLSLAQVAPDTASFQPKEKVDWKPSLIRVGYDLGSTALTLTSSTHQRQELMAEVDFGNWFVVGEVGAHSINRGDGYDYSSVGNYWRVGLDKNLTPKLPGRHIVSVGFRYASSGFDEALDYAGYSFRNANMTASWVEITSGIRMKLWKQLYLGYQLRLRGFKRLSSESGELETFDVPGFGRNKRSGNTVRSGGVGFSYYIYWTIPFREKELVPEAN
jgi:hypothetical protein